MFTSASAILFSVLGPAAIARAAISFNHPFTERGRISDFFGWRVPPFPGASSFHNGLDYDLPPGGIYSIASGTVTTRVVSDIGFGNHVVVTHSDDYASLYAHMASPPLVDLDQSIPASTQLEW